MENFLYLVVELITKTHNYIMTLNDDVEYNFTDKELHFIVIGALGLGMVFVLHPIFKWLAERGHIMTVSFFYVFTVIVVIAFAIEIGQWATGTGQMEFADIAAGIMGFLAMFAAFAVIRGICLLIWRLFRNRPRE